MISCKWTDWDREEEPAVPRCVLRTQGWVHPSVSAFDVVRIAGGKKSLAASCGSSAVLSADAVVAFEQ